MLEGAPGESKTTVAGPDTVVHEYVSTPAGNASSLAAPTNWTAPSLMEMRVGPVTRTDGGWFAAGSARTRMLTSAEEASSPSDAVSRRTKLPPPGNVTSGSSRCGSLKMTGGPETCVQSVVSTLPAGRPSSAAMPASCIVRFPTTPAAPALTTGARLIVAGETKWKVTVSELDSSSSLAVSWKT